MGQRALEYAALVPDPPYCGLIPIPPHQDPGLETKTTIPGIRSKKHTPWSALDQEAVATIEERLAGRVLLYTDGSVPADAGALRVPNARQRRPPSTSCFRATATLNNAGGSSAPGRLGLPHVSLDHLRFPQAHRSGLMRAFEALPEFLGDAALIARL
ncbi:hypothetical protein MRX96_015894 [Rhipicephalus microplus]